MTPKEVAEEIRKIKDEFGKRIDQLMEMPVEVKLVGLLARSSVTVSEVCVKWGELHEALSKLQREVEAREK